MTLDDRLPWAKPIEQYAKALNQKHQSLKVMYEPASVMDFVHLNYTVRKSDDDTRVACIAITFDDDTYKLAPKFIVKPSSVLPVVANKERAKYIASQMIPGSYAIHDEEDREKLKMVSPPKRPAVMHSYFTMGDTHEYTHSDIFLRDWNLTEFKAELIDPNIHKFLKLLQKQ